MTANNDIAEIAATPLKQMKDISNNQIDATGHNAGVFSFQRLWPGASFVSLAR